MKQKWVWIVLLVLAFILGLAFSAFAVSATSLSIQHNKKLPTPYELITKGTILHKYIEKDGQPTHYLAWDKTDDIYTCVIILVRVDCYLLEQSTRIAPK